jgi:hypothetical protein
VNGQLGQEARQQSAQGSRAPAAARVAEGFRHAGWAEQLQDEGLLHGALELPRVGGGEVDEGALNGRAGDAEAGGALGSGEGAGGAKRKAGPPPRPAPPGNENVDGPGPRSQEPE